MQPQTINLQMGRALKPLPILHLLKKACDFNKQLTLHRLGLDANKFIPEPEEILTSPRRWIRGDLNRREVAAPLKKERTTCRMR